MRFEPNYWYHVYNRGNNRQRIYFTSQNYLFFIKKIRKQIMPLADVPAYCLMPNHFHLLIHVKPPPSRSARCSCGLTGKEATERAGRKPGGRPAAFGKDIHPLVQKFAILLSSYTRAINEQENRSGSLFKAKTQAKNLSSGNRNYAETCFHYIHQNPLKAGLTGHLEDWQYSSYRDFAGLRQGTLPAKTLAFKAFQISSNQHFIDRSNQMLDKKLVDKIF